MKIERKKGRDEFATFVVVAALLCVAGILTGIFWLVAHNGHDGRSVQRNSQQVHVTVTCPGNTGEWIPITNGKG